MRFKRTFIASAVLFLGSSSVIAAAVLAPTPSAAPVANAAPATANLRQGVTAQHNVEEQGQAVQIVTGDLSQNELYIFAEAEHVPEKVIAENPDAQIAVLGGNEQKATQKVKEFQKTVAVVHEKIAKVKAVAAIQTQADDQKIQAWNDKKNNFSLNANKQNNADKIDLIQPLGVQHNKLALNVANVEMEPVHFSHEKLTRAADTSSHSSILAKQAAKPKAVASKSFTNIVKQLSAPSHVVVKATPSKLAAKTEAHAKIKHAVKNEHKVTAMKPVVHAEQKSKLKSIATKQHRGKISADVFVPKSKAFVKTGKINILHRPYKAVATSESVVKITNVAYHPVRAYHAPTPAKLAAREHALLMLEKQLAQEDEPVISAPASRRSRYTEDSEESHPKAIKTVRVQRYASRSNDAAEPVSTKRRTEKHSPSYNAGSYETASSDRAEKLAKQMRDPAQFAKLMQD